MKLAANKYTIAMDPAITIYAVFGVLAFVGSLTLLIFAGSYISKSGKCKSFQKKRQATVSNQVHILTNIYNIIKKVILASKQYKFQTIHITVLYILATKDCKKCAQSTCYGTVDSLFQH